MAEAAYKPEIAIRPAALGDVPRLLGFFGEIEKATENVLELFRVGASERFFGGLAGGDILVAELDGEVVGMVGVSTEKAGYCALSNLFVDPKSRELGFGGLLVKAGHELARSRGAKTAILLIFNSTGATEFYKHQGYRETARWMEAEL